MRAAILLLSALALSGCAVIEAMDFNPAGLAPGYAPLAGAARGSAAPQQGCAMIVDGMIYSTAC